MLQRDRRTAEILAFPRQAVGANHDNADGDRPPANPLLALDGVGKTLADLLLALLTDLEDSSLRLSLVIERRAREAARPALRSEQQEIRATIAELRRAIGDRARIFGRG